jgi:hypothetical protein
MATPKLPAPKHDVLLNFKAPAAVADQIRALAEFLGVPYGKMIRDLCAEKRRQLRASGQRPPAAPVGR